MSGEGPTDRPHAVAIERSRAFAALPASDRVEAERLLRDELLSDRRADRFVAMAVIRENAVTSMIPAMRQLVVQLESSEGPATDTELANAHELLARLEDIASPPPLADMWRRGRVMLIDEGSEKTPNFSAGKGMSAAYGRLTPEQRIELESLLREWLVSGVDGDRSDAMSIIRDHDVTAMIPALRQLRDRFAFPTDAPSRYQLERVDGLLEQLGDDVQPPRIDPVRQRRANAQRLASIASRAGYALIAGAVVTFFVAFFTDFDATMATIITAALIGGCVLLAPAIILGYAVKAAEREDRDRGY